MNYLNNKKILLIISGGIAAYKSLDLIRILKKNGSLVKTIMTKSSTKFITPLSVASLSQEKVYTELFNHENESEMDHISLSRWADTIIIAPATANIISKIGSGLADDLATTVILASNKKIFIAPAMNVMMWEHKSNQNNIKQLKKFGYLLIGPIRGDMACGEYGLGKMTDPNLIYENLNNYFKNINYNIKLKAIVTAGPTIEAIDPVRYISNHSSGKQGYELARALSDNGFETTLISGPTNLDAPRNVKSIKVKTTDEMFNETLKNLPTDVAIFSAAVSDYKVVNYSKKKLKKNNELFLNLKKNRDILEYVSKHNSLRPKIVVGFAAETNDLEKYAKEKLEKKNCDWVIANDVNRNDIGFNSDMNEINIFYNNNINEKIFKTSKSEIADEIVKRITKQLNS